MIKQFQGEYRFLSNFWFVPRGITIPEAPWDGLTYPTIEHAYQAAKTVINSEREAIASVKMPGEAKKLGRKVTLRPDWDKMKISYMREFTRQKYLNVHLRTLLIKTHPMELQEGNYWGDTFWGVDLKTGKGENNLGKILMEERAIFTEGK